MNYKSLLAIVFGVVITSSAFAQSNLLNAKSPDQIGVKSDEQKALDNNKPLEYGYVGDKDIMFSKIVWEKVVLDERVNFPLYYPIDTNNIGNNRRSLYDVLIKAITNGDIKNVYNDSYFTGKRTEKELADITTKVDTLDIGYDQLNSDGYVDQEYITTTEISSFHITAYFIKGMWYFDKRQGELRFRIIGLAPAAPDVNFLDDPENGEPNELFWVFFPDAREVLHKATAFNSKNSAAPFTFDHILNSHRYNGIIYKEENVFGDRKIDEYVAENALFQLLESERVKEKIRNFELDIWSY